MEASLDDRSFRIHTGMTHFTVVTTLNRDSVNADLPRVECKDR